MYAAMYIFAVGLLNQCPQSGTPNVVMPAKLVDKEADRAIAAKHF
jgi:hypothetical protein